MNIITEKLNELYYNQNDILIEYYNRDLNRIENIISEGFIQNKLVVLVDSYKKNINTTNKFLIDQGINLSRVKSKSSILAKSVKSSIKNREKPEVIQLKLSKGAAKIIREEVTYFKQTFDEKSLNEKITSSIAIFVTVVIINTVLGLIGYIFFGPAVGNILLALIIAPIVEESAKKISVVEKYPWIYTGIFAGLELLQYVIKLVLAGGMFGPVLIIRLSALMMHFCTTYVQKYFKEKGDTETAAGIDNNWQNIGYCLAIGIHFTWNLLGLIFNKDVKSFVGL